MPQSEFCCYGIRSTENSLKRYRCSLHIIINRNYKIEISMSVILKRPFTKITHNVKVSERNITLLFSKFGDLDKRALNKGTEGLAK